MEQIPKEIKYIDLFCGLGAFHTAFNRYNNIQNKVKYTWFLHVILMKVLEIYMKKTII